VTRPEHIHVWYREDGQIVAWGHVPVDVSDRIRAEPIADPRSGHHAGSFEVPEGELDILHVTHQVDHDTQTLVPREG
jgi:hypothetical protein